MKHPLEKSLIILAIVALGVVCFPLICALGLIGGLFYGMKGN